MKLRTITKILLSWSLAFLIFTLTFISWASAQEDARWLPRRWQKPIRHHHLYHGERRPRAYYRAIEESPRYSSRCFGRIFTDKGREFQSEEAALKDAERSWSALVREEPGEKWMDLKYAERYESRCQRSSTGESTAAKVVDSLTGGNLGTLYRCRIWAEPCTAPKSQDGGRER